MSQIQCICHQGTRGSDAGLHAGAEFGGREFQHMRSGFPAELSALFRAGQGPLGQRLAVGMVQVGPMRSQLDQLAFGLQDHPASPRYQRQRCPRVWPTCLLIEHTLTLETGSDIPQALKHKSRLPPARRVAGFAGDDRYIVDYLAEEVLDRQSEDVQDFLLQTFILDRLTDRPVRAGSDVHFLAATLELVAGMDLVSASRMTLRPNSNSLPKS